MISCELEETELLFSLDKEEESVLEETDELLKDDEAEESTLEQEESCAEEEYSLEEWLSLCTKDEKELIPSLEVTKEDSIC